MSVRVEADFLKEVDIGKQAPRVTGDWERMLGDDPPFTVMWAMQFNFNECNVAINTYLHQEVSNQVCHSCLPSTCQIIMVIDHRHWKWPQRLLYHISFKNDKAETHKEEHFMILGRTVRNC